eukprot:gene12374-biopygen4934
MWTCVDSYGIMWNRTKPCGSYGNVRKRAETRGHAGKRAETRGNARKRAETRGNARERAETRGNVRKRVESYGSPGRTGKCMEWLGCRQKRSCCAPPPSLVLTALICPRIPNSLYDASCDDALDILSGPFNISLQGWCCYNLGGG